MLYYNVVLAAGLTVWYNSSFQPGTGYIATVGASPAKREKRCQF